MTPTLPPTLAGAPPADVARAPLSQRIDSMDLLRGVAILGIFVMNTWSFSQPQYAYTNPNAYTTEWVQGVGFPDNHEMVHGAEFAVYSIVHVLADMKFITMFSMLFGAGILLQGERAAARGLSPWRIHYSRMVVLLIFGIIHAYALWYGDILTGYASCGLLLFPLRKARPTLLIVLGVVMIAMVSVIDLSAAADSHLPVISTMTDWNNRQFGADGGNDFELAAYRGGWLEQMQHREPAAWTGQTYGFVMWTFWRCGGAILIGMALHKRRFFHGEWRREAYASLAVLAIPIGWAVTGAGIVFNQAIGWDDSPNTVLSVSGLGAQFNYWGSLVTELGYISLGVLVAMRAAQPAHAWLRKCLWPLRAIGRTALSNYILQSLIGTTLFYGHGFGLFGTVSRVGLLYIVGTVWIVQLIISPIYLSFFRQGPLEWVWHRLVYWRGEPPPLKDMAASL